MKEEMVKITMDVPKSLRARIRVAAARNDRLVSAEVRDTLEKIYAGVSLDIAVDGPVTMEAWHARVAMRIYH